MPGGSDRYMHARRPPSVKTHSAGASAAEAKAYSQGSDLQFGAGEYQPESDAGRSLIAHELTHVAQPSGAGPADIGAAVGHYSD